MKNSAEAALAFSAEREAIAATSESSHCIIAGSTRRWAIEAAPRIPHLTLLVIIVSARCLKQPNQESSDRATAYRIWPAKHKPVLQFPSEPQRQLPRAQKRRSPNQGASMPRSSVCLLLCSLALFPTE